jgi:hypothetical protein
MDNLPDEMKIANCRCCLLADAMKDCKACQFRIGLVYRQLDRLAQATKPNEADKARMERLKSLILA